MRRELQGCVELFFESESNLGTWKPARFEFWISKVLYLDIIDESIGWSRPIFFPFLSHSSRHEGSIRSLGDDTLRLLLNVRSWKAEKHEDFESLSARSLMISIYWPCPRSRFSLPNILPNHLSSPSTCPHCQSVCIKSFYPICNSPYCCIMASEGTVVDGLTVWR